MNAKRILGIDPGSRLCGYGIVEVLARGQHRYVECGVIQLNERHALATRLYELGQDLRDIFREVQPQELAVEALFHGVNAQSVLRLAHARGVVLFTSAEAGIPVFEYPPATVKRAVAGHGRASKSDVQRMVAWQCGLQALPSPDAADALAVALCHSFHHSVLGHEGVAP